MTIKELNELLETSNDYMRKLDVEPTTSNAVAAARSAVAAARQIGGAHLKLIEAVVAAHEAILAKPAMSDGAFAFTVGVHMSKLARAAGLEP